MTSPSTPGDWYGSIPDDLRDPLRDANGKPARAWHDELGESAVGRIQGYIGADTVYKSALLLGPFGDSRFVYPTH